MQMGVEVPRVLIADADSALRQQLFSALLNADIFADCVGNTADALDRLDAGVDYGVLVLDVTLPYGDVERILEQVKTKPAAERPVVLILAANAQAARSLDVEIVQIVLRKPVNISQLVDMVRSCTRGARARRLDASRKANGHHVTS